MSDRDTPFDKAPDYPVIVVHLADENYPNLTACGPFLIPDAYEPRYRNVPRYQCPACYRQLMEVR